MLTPSSESDFLITIPAAASSLDVPLARDPLPHDNFLWSESPGSSPRTLPPLSARSAPGAQSASFQQPLRPSTTTQVPHRLQPLDTSTLPTTKSQSPRWWDMPKNVAKECDRFDRRHGELSERAFNRLAHVEDDVTSEKADWHFRRHAWPGEFKPAHTGRTQHTRRHARTHTQRHKSLFARVED